MENQEEKKCCEGKEAMTCEHGMGKCCHGWKKCRCLKIIFFIIILAIAFHIGAEWGEMKGGYKGGDRSDRGMMNWGENKFYSIKGEDFQRGTGSVTVEVTKPDTTPSAPAAPAPKQ